MGSGKDWNVNPPTLFDAQRQGRAVLESKITSGIRMPSRVFVHSRRIDPLLGVVAVLEFDCRVRERGADIFRFCMLGAEP